MDWIRDLFGRWDVWFHDERVARTFTYRGAESYAYKNLPFSGWDVRRR